MAVRFLPPPEEHPRPQREETGDLAEVIEFRSRLRRPESPSSVVSDTAPEPPEAPASDARPAASGNAAPAERTWAKIVEAPFAQTAGAREVPELDGPTPYETAVKLLARRALSSGELLRALVSAGHPDIDAEEAVAQCVQSLYLDDADLACSVAAKLRDSKGESKARIRQKLRERHLPDAAIELALEGLDDDAELELLRQTAADRARRMVGLDRQTAERRLLGFLARRGWGGERAARAVRDALDGGVKNSRSGGSSVRFE